jgi:hypothetical protein
MNTQQAGNARRKAEAALIWGARREQIVRLYQIEEKPQQAVADHYGVTLGAIQKVMKRLGIQSRVRANLGTRNGRYRHGMASTMYRAMVQKRECIRCSTVEALCIHHKDGNHRNNTPDNLEVLCMACHSRMHKSEWWRSRKGGLL